jgi:ATP/maltotriose-dependent transcriptional regulator MalT
MKRYLRAYLGLYRTRRSTLVTLCITLLALSLAYGAVRGAVNFIRDVTTVVSDSKQDARDAAHETNVNASLSQSQASEANANSFSTDRQVSDARAADANAVKESAAKESRRTLEPTRKARRRYEETRRSPVDDTPALPDSRICAELAARNINFSGCR